MSISARIGEKLRSLSQYRVLPLLIAFPVAVAGGQSLARGWQADHAALVALVMGCTAYAFFCLTSCFHECAHLTLTGKRWFDVWLGRALGTAMLTPYTAYREAHIRHHAYLNKPDDWELWPYTDPYCSLAFRRLFAWLDLVCGSLTAPFIYGRIYFAHQSPLRSKSVRRVIGFEYLAIAAFWGSIVGTVAGSHCWTPFVLGWVVPWWLAGVIQTGRKFTEHLGMASYDPLLGTRTVLGTSRLTGLFTFLNFDIFIHGPHHRHPHVQHDELGNKMAAYVRQHPDVSYPIYTSYWQAVWAMLSSLFRNPGCGMNAGAPSPRKHVEVEDFVADVTTQVMALESA